MYEKLIKSLRVEPFEVESVGLAKTMNEAADAIEELIAELNHADDQIERLVEAAEERRWIPVTERKPKTDDIVIVAIHDDSGDTPYDRAGVGFYLDVQSIGVWVVENERCNYITSWMPLPPPPKEG